MNVEESLVGTLGCRSWWTLTCRSCWSLVDESIANWTLSLSWLARSGGPSACCSSCGTLIVGSSRNWLDPDPRSRCGSPGPQLLIEAHRNWRWCCLCPAGDGSLLDPRIRTVFSSQITQSRICHRLVGLTRALSPR